MMILPLKSSVEASKLQLQAARGGIRSAAALDSDGSVSLDPDLVFRIDSEIKLAHRMNKQVLEYVVPDKATAKLLALYYGMLSYKVDQRLNLSTGTVRLVIDWKYRPKEASENA